MAEDQRIAAADTSVIDIIHQRDCRAPMQLPLGGPRKGVKNVLGIFTEKKKPIHGRLTSSRALFIDFSITMFGID